MAEAGVPLEPIAIIGMSCRLPGSAQDPVSLWDMLISGRTAWTSGPGKRFNMSAFQDGTGIKSGMTNTCGGHFLKEDVSAFDAAFFGIHPAEAMAMDPQHRLLLEIAYECFENAGLSVDSLWGTDTGVYVGQWSNDYHEIETRDIDAPPLYLITGTGPAISSNRISYYYNLRGPSFTVDTGCSSSFVALHQAVQSLRAGETSQCFVAGVNLLLDPQRFVYQSRLKTFSKEGRSYAFDSRANGYGRGEGCTGVMLKPLSAALRDGDQVRAVIRHSVLNQDGRTAGITVPSAKAQEEAILRAFNDAKLDLHVDYVEAHGTGTKVGDPNEAGAIAATLAKGRHSSSPLPIGSIKANVGHTEGAAGLAGLIKAVLMLEHSIIPPQANYITPNPELRLGDRKLRIPTELEYCELRRISVNSFGYGGTNAHVVLDAKAEEPYSAPTSRLVNGNSAKGVERLFFISAASENACRRTCRRLAKYLIQKHRNSPEPNEILARLAHSLGKQSIHAYRLALIASNLNDLVQQLTEAASNAVIRRESKDEARIALVFSGQGAQYAEMGRELLSKYSVFAQSIEHASRHLIEIGSQWNLEEELCKSKSETRINEPAFSQPLTTAVQLALVDTLAHFDISACAVVGHSSGEIAAAYASQAISFEDAMTAAYFRGKLTTELIAGNPCCDGAMLAVGDGPESVNDRILSIESFFGKMRVACFNSPNSVTVSGDAGAVMQLKTILDAEGTFNRKLSTNGAAYHSHHMEAMRQAYSDALETALTRQPNHACSNARMFSSVTGKEVEEQTSIDGAYWVANLLSPVLFSDALGEMARQKFRGKTINMIVEVGPHSQLGGAVKQTLKLLPGGAGQIPYTTALQRGKNSAIALMECLGAVHAQTATLPIDRINGLRSSHMPKRLVDLPPYPFDHDTTFWHETRISRDYRQRKHTPHELLGTLSHDSNRLEPRWRRFLSLKESPWLKGHLVQGQIVFPAAGFITMAVQAMRQHTSTTSPSAKVESLLFRNISIGRALVIHEDGPDVEIVLSLRPEPYSASKSSTVWSEFRIFTVSADENWTEHCRGLIHAEMHTDEARHATSDRDVDKQCIHGATPQRLYHLGRSVGLDWQYPFNNVSSIRTCQDACMATARQTVSESNPGGMGDVLHPTVLDSCLFHGICAVLIIERNATSTFVPNFIKRLRIFNEDCGPRSDLVSTSTASQHPMTFDVVIEDVSGGSSRRTVVAAEGVRTTTLPGETTLNQVSGSICHNQKWVTYVDDWTLGHRAQVLKSVVPPGSSHEQNRLLDALTLHFVQKAVRQVGLNEVPEGPRRHFFRWMQAFAASFPDMVPLPKASATPDIKAFAEGIRRLGPNLSDILTEKTDPLALLTPDDLLTKLYNVERSDRCIIQIAEYCHELGKQKPGLNVLEVGAGTASATLPVLEALNNRSGNCVRSYTFTDISTGFFEAAKGRLGSFLGVLEFALLDIEVDPEEQGFRAASYDLIIASNVIHATKRIGPVLANIRRLLKPGGKFLLMELTRPTPHYNLLFGVFKAWWAGYDEGRQLTPLISRSQWISRLKSADFVNPEMWFEDYPEEDGGSISVFVASAPSDYAEMEEEEPPIHVVTSHHGLVESLDSEMMSCLKKEEVVASRITTCSLSTASPGSNVVIILPEVAEMLCSDTDAPSWKRFKDWILRARAVLLVSCGDSQDSLTWGRGLWLGFARCLRLEHPSIRLITLDIGVERPLMIYRLAQMLPSLLRSSTLRLGIGDRGEEKLENEFKERDGQLFVSRFVANSQISDSIHRNRSRAAPEPASFLDKRRLLWAELRVPGLLESIRWKGDAAPPDLGPDDVKLELRAASINFKDVLIAAGQLEGITEMRNDCSGIVVEAGSNMRERFKPGDRVCALYSRSYTNYPVVHGDCCQIVPDNLTWEEAAALPIVWTTVYYSLVDMGRLAKGDKILIHSAAGAVGQAAIMLAQHLGADIFATVGSSSKRELLREKYGVPDDHIFSSRTSAFHDGIRRLSGGYGVDVVLNSLSGEMFRHSCNLVAPFGRFVEIGQKDLLDDARMSMGFLLKNITFAYVDLSLVIEKKKALARRLLQNVAELAAAGSVKAVTLTTMPISEIETAFRQIQAGKHTGKIILTVNEDQKVKADPLPPPQAKLSADATYVVVGGFGGLGRSIIAWMGKQGAKNILSTSRSGRQDQQSLDFAKEMSTRGVRVIAKKCDVTVKDEITALIGKSVNEGLPPIRGVIHCAMVLQDALFEDMTWNQWGGALAPKIKGSLNLHECFGGGVDFFILMSSAVALRGNVGQSNYAAACSFQDALARHRTRAGMPAFSINVGPVLEVGFVSENPEVAAALKRQGLGTISISDLLAMLNYAVTHPLSSDAADSVCAIGLLPKDGDASLTDPRFAHLVQHDRVGGAAEAEGHSADLPRQLDAATRAEETCEIICQAVLRQLGKLIASPAESLSPAKSLDSYGVDSLVAVELRNWIGAYLQANVPLMALRGAGSIHEVAGLVAKESRLVKADHVQA